MTIERFGLDPENELGLSDDDVVAIPSKDFGLETMSKISVLIKAIDMWCARNSNNKGSEVQWFAEKGFECELLRTVGGGWQKGRFRFRIEFIPNSPEAFLNNSLPEEKKLESPLDDLRSQLNPE